MKDQQNIIIYNTADGKASVSLYAKVGMAWMNQSQLAELFDTSIPNISMHASNIFEEKELDHNSVVKDFFTTASACQQTTVGAYGNTPAPPICQLGVFPYAPTSVKINPVSARPAGGSAIRVPYHSLIR